MRVRSRSVVELVPETQTRVELGDEGGWSRNDRKVDHMKQRGLLGLQTVFIVRDGSRGIDDSRSVDTKSRPTGVRGTVVATKPGNSGGAKGPRKMDDV